MYYYKQVENGVVTAVLTCDTHLESSDFQVEITEEEYNILLAEMQAESGDENA